MKKQISDLIVWYEENKRDLPFRHTKDPYKIWVSEIMLQQTRVEAVKPYYERFIREIPDVKALAETDDERLVLLWQGLGYYSRARNMKKAAMTCMEKFGGELPGSSAELCTLSGVGRYTAAAVASFAFGEAVPAVDGNVLRVCARYLGISDPINAPAVQKRIYEYLCSVISKEDPGLFNYALMELGATVCGPDRQARCGGCPLLADCKAFAENKTQSLPVRLPKKEKRIAARTLLLVHCGEKTAFLKRPGKGLLAGLWEPPALEGSRGENEARAFLEAHGCAVREIKRLPDARHVFTHVVWEMSAFFVQVDGEGDLPFYSKEEIAGLAFPSAFKAYKAYF